MIHIVDDMHYATVLEKIRDIENTIHPDGHPDAGMMGDLQEAVVAYQSRRYAEATPQPAPPPEFPRNEHSAYPRSEITGMGERVPPGTLTHGAYLPDQPVEAPAQEQQAAQNAEQMHGEPQMHGDMPNEPVP